ncbi:MAG: hypothetical protein KDB80_05940, partial [Planctomycetes bacterium]|nr:hypothetical protein [Planctomycetota bacterium]
MHRHGFELGTFAAVLAAGAAAQTSAPVSLRVTVDTAAVAATGRASAKLAFSVSDDVDAVYSVRLDLQVDGHRVMRRDHAPPKSTRTWRKGETVEYELPLPFRAGDPPLDPNTTITLRAGFLGADGYVVPLAGARRDRDDLVPVGTFVFPGIDSAAIDEAAVDAAIRAANESARAGRPGEAWDRIEFVFRRTENYVFKAKLRDALRQVGKFDPPEPTFEEQAIVRGRIADERRRYLRRESSRMLGRGELHGALLILDAIGGSLAEDVDRAVLGALDDAERVTQDRDDIVQRITRSPTQAEKTVARDWIEQLDSSSRLLEKARALAKSGDRAVARQILHHLSHSGDDKTRGPAAEARDALDEAWIADVPA